jgi:hypothetical protein
MNRDEETPTLADDLFAMDRPRDPHRWPVGDRIFWIAVFAVFMVLLIAFVPVVAALMSAAVPPMSARHKPQHAREIRYSVLSTAVDVIALLARPLWAVTDPSRRRWVALRAWLAEEPSRIGLLIDVALVVVVFVAALIGGI